MLRYIFYGGVQSYLKDIEWSSFTIFWTMSCFRHWEPYADNLLISYLWGVYKLNTSSQWKAFLNSNLCSCSASIFIFVIVFLWSLKFTFWLRTFFQSKYIEQIMIWSSRWYMLQNQILDLQTMIFLWTYRGWDAVRCIMHFDFLLL